MVHKKKFKLEPIKLKTVRPLLFKSIDLGDYADEISGDMALKTEELCFNMVTEMIEDAKLKVLNCLVNMLDKVLNICPI